MIEQKKNKPAKIRFNLGFRESVGVVVCAVIFFFLPMILIEYSKQLNPANTETYTEQAITSAQGEGRVAGVTTSDALDKYFTVPIINFRFDKTLSETPSIFFLFGVILFSGGIVLGISMFASSNKKMFIPAK